MIWVLLINAFVNNNILLISVTQLLIFWMEAG